MKIKKLMIFALILIMINLIFCIKLINAEMYFWENIIIDNSTSTVTQHGYYQFQDSSNSFIGRNKNIEIVLWYTVEALPKSLYIGSVDWCNFTISHIKNEYDKEGNFLNYTTNIYNYYFTNSSLNSSQLTFYLKDRDSLVNDMVCHYTNIDELYVDNALIGRYGTYFPAFECDDCGDYTIEQLSNEIEKIDKTTQNQISIYEKIQNLIYMNFQIWLILVWLVKLGFIIAGIGLIFLGIYWFYLFIKDIEQRI